MTKWFHKCSLDWLRARQNYLTATDVKELLPVTKTGRKRTITDENYEVYSAKYDELTAEYHETYKAMMTDEQISKYTELRTRYQKKVVGRTASKVGEKVDSVGQKVIKGVKKTGSKVSGFLKGIFGKK